MSDFIFPTIPILHTPSDISFNDLDFCYLNESHETSIDKDVLNKLCDFNSLKNPVYDYSHQDQMYITALTGSWYLCWQIQTGNTNKNYENFIRSIAFKDKN